MQRYFVTTKDNDVFSFSITDAHHIKNVMRMSLETEVEIVYDEELYLAKLISIEPALAKVLKKIPQPKESNIKVTIAQALVKEQKMDFILQKSTELGISEIIPLMTERSLMKIDKKQDKKLKRWENIVKEASEQSKRISLPSILKPLSIKELSLLDYDIKILCTVNEMSKTLNKVLSNVDKRARILFVVGPEGGFTPIEEKTLIDRGFISTSLGSLVLRTETVSIYVMSVIQYLFMR